VSGEAEVLILDAAAAAAAIEDLADVLVDCVAGGASVSFMQPFGRDEATAFFRGVTEAVKRGDTVLIAARAGGRILGTVQLGLDMPPNQPHRGEIKKMLVHRSARRRGIGAALLQRAEAEAKARGRTLLVLDTASRDAERVYERCGWQRAGTIPDYALWPGGGLCDTTIFWKKLQ
jgi:GNAT superfamily N-acetyltransferase